MMEFLRDDGENVQKRKSQSVVWIWRTSSNRGLCDSHTQIFCERYQLFVAYRWQPQAHSLEYGAMVIHGGINGYSRRIVFLHCSGNNRGEAALSLFQEAANHHDILSRLRDDHGWVAEYLISHPERGPLRGSRSGQYEKKI